MSLPLSSGITVEIGECPDPEPAFVLPGITADIFEWPSPDLELTEDI